MTIIHEDHWKSIADRFLLEPTSLRKGRRFQGGFSGAMIFQIETNFGRFALRAWPPGALPPERILELHRFLKHLEAEGIPVAVPLAAAGSTETLIEDRGRLWQLESWLPGSPVRGIDINEEQLANLMRGLARLHLAAARYHPSRTGGIWFQSGNGVSPALRERRRIIASWTPAKIIQARLALNDEPGEFRAVANDILSGFLRFAEQIDLELARWEDEIVPLHPCWRDLWSEHVLFVGNELTGIIDPGAARADHISSDLSRLLGSLFGEERARWGKALEIYSSLRPVSASEYRLIQVMDRSSVLLSGMNWIDRWQCDRLLDNPDQVVQRMRALVQRLREMT